MQRRIAVRFGQITQKIISLYLHVKSADIVRLHVNSADIVRLHVKSADIVRHLWVALLCDLFCSVFNRYEVVLNDKKRKGVGGGCRA